ncbi:unnamed protein product, partial [Sphacelaria rigidula]
QDEDFEAVPENQDFTLTLEKPTKFGYSPGFKIVSGGTGLPSPGSLRSVTYHADNANRTTLRTNGLDWLPPSGPGLFRNRTAPVAAGSLDGDCGVGTGSGAFVQWSGRSGSDGGSGKAPRHQRNETLTDYRFESIGSTADWSQTFEGNDIDISKAQRPRSPLDIAPTPPAAAIVSRQGANSSPNGMAFLPAPGTKPLAVSFPSGTGTDHSDGTPFNSGGGAGVGHSVSGDNSQVSAVTVAWEAFKAHSAAAGGGGGHVGDALTNTIKAAAAATSLAVEHLRKRSRHRLLLEKGVSSNGRRLSGPLQITLEDLKAPPGQPISMEGEGLKDVWAGKSPTSGAAAAAAAATGAHFNAEKMCWEGFEEPDLTGFDSDSDSDDEQKGPKDAGTGLGREVKPEPPEDSELTPPEPAPRLLSSSGSKSFVIHDRRQSHSKLPPPNAHLVVSHGEDSSSSNSSHNETDSSEDSGFGTSSLAAVGLEGVSPGATVDAGAATAAPAAVSAGRQHKNGIVGTIARSFAAFSPTKTAAAALAVEDTRGADLEEVAPGDGGSGQAVAVVAGVDHEVEWDVGAQGTAVGKETVEEMAVKEPGSVAQPISDWDRNFGSPTAAIKAASAASATTCASLLVHAPGPTAAAAAAAALGGSRQLEPVTEDNGLVFRAVEPRSKVATAAASVGGGGATDTAGLPMVGKSASGGGSGSGGGGGGGLRAMLARRPSTGPVLFTPSALDMSMLGVVAGGGWGDGPSTVAPTPQHPSTGPPSGDVSSRESQAADFGAAGDGGVGMRSGLHNMVSRSIFPGPMRDAAAPDSWEGDQHASTSHLTKSTEDDTVDDWGADFVGGLCLTPKTGGGGSMWGHPELDGYGGENREREGHEVRGRCSEPFTADSSSSPGPRSPTKSRRLHGSHQHDRRGDARPTSAFYHSLPGRTNSAGAGRSGALLGATTGSAVRHPSPPPARSTVYGPSVKRIPVEVTSDMVLAASGVSGRDALNDDSDEAGADGGDEGGAGSGGGGGGVVAGEKSTRERKRSSFRKTRRRRSRGYQTISKAEYAPVYVPTAWLNPKSGRWEPVDGYAVDMSGFGSAEEGEGASAEPPSRRGSTLSDSSWRNGGGVAGGGNLQSPPLSRGPSSSSTPPHAHEQLKRRGSIQSSSGGSYSVSRADAFKLSPATLKHLASNEEEHNQAMLAFLGDEGYSRAKREGAARLLRRPGIASAAAKKPVSPSSFARTRRRPAGSGGNHTSSPSGSPLLKGKGVAGVSTVSSSVDDTTAGGSALGFSTPARPRRRSTGGDGARGGGGGPGTAVAEAKATPIRARGRTGPGDSGSARAGGKPRTRRMCGSATPPSSRGMLGEGDSGRRSGDKGGGSEGIGGRGHGGGSVGAAGPRHTRRVGGSQPARSRRSSSSANG